jgi:hypothetical protein
MRFSFSKKTPGKGASPERAIAQDAMVVPTFEVLMG